MRKLFLVVMAMSLAFTAAAVVPASSLTLAATHSSFDDVDPAAFYADAVAWAEEYGVTNGVSPTMFGPDLTMSRAEGLTMMWRDAGSPTGNPDAGFTDVPAGAYFAEAVNWAKAKGITNGISSTLFGPSDGMTRAMFVTMLWRAAGSPTGHPDAGFTDVPAGAYFAEAVNWAKATGVTTGTSATTFSPGNPITRGQGVTQMYRQPVDLQFLTISDWHAQLDPLFVFGVGTFGGAAELSAYFDMERAANPNTVTLTAGDAYGGAPPLSGFFDEEPAVRAMRLMGFDVDTFGNHNFDQGVSHLQRMVTFAGAPAGLEPGDPFKYVSANLTNRDANLTGVEDYVILDRNGIKIAVIGITNPEAPSLVFPGNFGTMVPSDPIPAAQAARDAAEAAGADVFVALTHLGITTTGPAAGPIVDFANGVTGFDLILGDHTNVEFTDTVNGALIVENRSRGRTYARVIVNANRSGEVFDSSVVFVEPVSADVTPDPEIVALLDPLRDELDVLLSGVIGRSTVAIPRSDECGQDSGRICESLVGDVVTDAMRDRYGTDFAIMNSGGLRADLTCPDPDVVGDFCPAPDGGDLEITDGSVLTVLPFGNNVVTLSVTGAELKEHLENGVSAMPGISGRFAQVSGLCFTYDIGMAAGSRVVSAVHQAGDGSCTGPAVDLTAGTSYTLAENDFMSSGGDDYPDDIASAATREPLDQVTADYIAANTPISPAIGGRITCIDTDGPDDCPVPI